MTHELMQLPFEANALEPHMDEETVKIHYGKHHQGYVDKLNAIIKEYPELTNKTVEWLLENISDVSSEIRQKVINFGGGVYNHNIFWNILKKDVVLNPESEIAKAITQKFGSFENFKEEFENKSNTLFGSGWTWLVLNKNQLEIIQTTNQESPLSGRMVPLIAIDVWEHAYYLKYQNKRPEFTKNFWNILNWNKVNELYIQAKQ
ncbi:MAG: superoxide dismutase [Nanoarchaeota archaeon]|jgi:Fe-Mn family superoxide dismutase|nr:superoxide dismutase [Nanoarchaeota archaeon]